MTYEMTNISRRICWKIVDFFCALFFFDVHRKIVVGVKYSACDYKLLIKKSVGLSSRDCEHLRSSANRSIVRLLRFAFDSARAFAAWESNLNRYCFNDTIVSCSDDLMFVRCRASTSLWVSINCVTIRVCLKIFDDLWRFDQSFAVFSNWFFSNSISANPYASIWTCSSFDESI